MRNILIGFAALFLWLATVVLGILEITMVRAALLTLYGWIVSRGGTELGQLRASYWSSVFIGQAITVIMAIVMVGVAIGGGEYHAKHLGERRSWRLFGWTLGIELIVFLVTYRFV